MIRDAHTSPRVTNERGAVLIQVAVAMLALLALSSFVIDHGVMLSGRRAAQNAADSGALAGAQSLLLLQGDNAARDTATALATRHSILNRVVTPGNVTVTVPLECPAPFDTPSGCIKVDISKQDVPTFFARLADTRAQTQGFGTQGVRATATAMVGAGNAVQCIKPWIVVDRWTDNSGTGSNTTGWDQEDVFEFGTDEYSPPGFRVKGPGNAVGLQLPLKGEGKDWSAGWSMEIDLGGGTGSPPYEAEIAGCPTWVPTVGLYNPAYPCSTSADTNPERGCINVKTGTRQGPTEDGLLDLVALDDSPSNRPYWNEATNSVSGGCMATGTCNNPTGVNISPRIVPIAIFDPVAYTNSSCAGGTKCVAQVVNLLGFFIEGMCTDVYDDEKDEVTTRPKWCGTLSEAKKTVIGRLMPYPGHTQVRRGTLETPASWKRSCWFGR